MFLSHYLGWREVAGPLPWQLTPRLPPACGCKSGAWGGGPYFLSNINDVFRSICSKVRANTYSIQYVFAIDISVLGVNPQLL